MNQKFALALAAVLTGFFIIAVASIAVSLMLPRPTTQLNVSAQMISQNNAPVPAVDLGNADVNSAVITQIKATDLAPIVTKAIGRAQITSTRLVNFQGTVAYEVITDRATLYIDANTGAVLANSATNAAAENRRTEHEEHEEHDDD